MKTKVFTILTSVTTKGKGKGDYTNSFMYFDNLDDVLRYYRMLLMLGYHFDYRLRMFQRKTGNIVCRVFPIIN